MAAGAAEVYVPTKIGGMEILTLIDSGNARGCLISQVLARKLDCMIEETDSKATGVQGSSIKIDGVVRNVEFQIGGHSFQEDCFVISGMTVPMNLGSYWLNKNNVKTIFAKDGNRIEMHGISVNLVAKRKIVVKNLVHTVLEKMEKARTKKPEINVAELQDQKWICSLKNRIEIPALSTVVVEVSTKGNMPEGQLCYIAPRQGYCSRNNLLINEGITEVGKNGKIMTKITNFETVKKSVPAGTLVGNLFLAEKIAMLQENRVKEDVSTTLKKIRFIKDKLKLDKVPFLKDNVSLKGRIVGLFLKNFKALSIDPTDIGSCTLEEYDIQLVPGAQPFKNRMIRLNPHHAEKLKEQIDLWLETDVIEECNSPFNSGIFAVKKKVGNTNEVKVRFVLDYRSLNEITEKICYPLPNIGELFDKLGGKKIFTSIDLTSAYNSMHLKESVRKYTAFCSNGRQYCFKRLPFGLTNAPSAFVKLMDRVMDLSPELRAFCLVYLDDVLVYSMNVEEHLEHLNTLLRTFCEAGLKINLGKCTLFAEEVKFLGHIINAEGIFMDQAYIEKIKNWPVPETGKDIQRFTGFINYYGSYFKNFSDITAPLNKFRNSSKIEWDEKSMEAFTKTRELFCEEISKSFPDWRMEAEPFVLDTDWSSTAMSAVLSQKQNGQEKMISCWSRVCSTHEANYAAHKGELCALVNAVERFECYLRHKKFIVRTDSAALKHLSTWRQNGYFVGLTIRWINFLSTFSYEVVHRQGKMHTNVDILSRTALKDSKDRISKLSTDEQGELILDTVYQLEDPKLCLIAGIGAETASQISSRLKAREFSRSLEKDPVLVEVRKFIVNNVKPTSRELSQMPYRGKQILRFFEHLSYKDGLIILTSPMRLQKEFQFIERVVVPIGMYNKVFLLAHADVTAGHRGYLETLSRINRHFIFPYVSKYVAAAVANCVICLNRRKKPKHNHNIEFSPLAGEAMAELAIDALGPLNECEYNGVICKHILIVVDSCTRYVWLFAIEDVKAETIIECLKFNLFSVWGLCERIRTDNAQSFKSKVFREVCLRLGIEQIFIPPRSANSNYSERYNQSVYSFLKTDLRFQDGDWAYKLKATQFCMNTSFNRRLGCSPYFKMFLRNPKLPLDSFDPLTRSKIKHMNFSELLECLDKNWRTGQERTEKYLQVENTERIGRPIAINSYCYIYYDVTTIGVARKLCSLWVGPCLVTKVISDSLFEVQPLEKCRLKDKGVRIVPRDKIYVIESTLDLTPDEKIDLVITDEFFSVDNTLKVNYDFPNTLRNLTCSGVSEEENSCGASPEVVGRRKDGQVTPDFLEKSFLGVGLSQQRSNVSQDNENLDDLVENLSDTLESTHISDSVDTNDTTDKTKLDSTYSTISKDSVFHGDYASDNSLIDNSLGVEDVNMESARELESRMSILEDTFPKLQSKIVNLEQRRGSVKRGRDVEEDELDRSLDNAKLQKMSETIPVKGRPKGSTNEVQLQKLEEDRQNREKDRLERYSVADVVTRNLAKLIKK